MSDRLTVVLFLFLFFFFFFFFFFWGGGGGLRRIDLESSNPLNPLALSETNIVRWFTD